LRRPAWLALLVFATAFGIAEAVVVIELRHSLDPAGDRFPLVDFPAAIWRFEQLREVATLVVLGAAAALAARRQTARFAAFLVAFGVWDLAYYAALRGLIHWPRHWNDWDLLFLVPVPWFGPVYAPVGVALVMLGAGSIALVHAARDGDFVVHARHIGAAVVGGGIVLASFLCLRTPATPPSRFPIELWAIGLAIGIAGFADAWRTNRHRGARLTAPRREPAPPPVGASSSAGVPTSTARGARAPQLRDAG
jgi:hypothetical protein